MTRKGGDVLLVHRPRYDDWSFPKGKLDPGEHTIAAAVREVAEETGLDVRLGPPLPGQCYVISTGRTKVVSYWTARVVGDDDVGCYRVNSEIDEVAWVPWDEARTRLTYDHDRDTLDAARPLRRRTRALVVLRHGKARSRKAWRGDDRRRPLLVAGGVQAERLVPLLAGFGVTAVHTSSSTRCVDTVAPYARTTGARLVTHDGLSEEDATVESVVGLVDGLLDAREATVVCTHRPVLPTVVDVLAQHARRSVADAMPHSDPFLHPAQVLVAHVARTPKGPRVVATETHRPHEE